MVFMRLIFFSFIFFFVQFTVGQTTLVPLHRDGVITNEPCIAMDPINPAFQFLGSNTSFIFTSSDGGFTWKSIQSNPKEGFYGDPVTWIGKNGNYYLLHLSKNPAKTWPAHFDRIVFEKSTNQGESFISRGIGFKEGTVQDKPWFYLDEWKKSKYKGRIYVTWTRFDKYGSKSPSDSSRILISHSGNDGDTFSAPTVINDVNGDAADNDNTLEGATTASGKNGELYAVWAGAGKIWFDKSLDGGVTWGVDKAIAEQKNGWNLDGISGLMRANSMPFVVTDNKGCIYVVFGDDRNGDQDVFVVYSKDKGQTWSSPARINDDAMGNGKQQYMPHVGVDRKTGKVFCVFYDRRNSEMDRFTDVYIAELKKGKPQKNYRITNEAFAVPGKDVFFGDYITVAAAKGEIRVAFSAFDHEKNIPTVWVAALTDKIYKKSKSNTKPAYVQLVELKDTSVLYLQLNIPEGNGAALEIKRGNQLVMKQLFEKETKIAEVMLPLSNFKAGVYTLTMTFKNGRIQKDFFVERK